MKEDSPLSQLLTTDQSSYRTLLNGFVAAATLPEAFSFFKELFTELDKLAADYQRCRVRDGLYLRAVYGEKEVLSEIFAGINLLYQRDYAPIKLNDLEVEKTSNEEITQGFTPLAFRMATTLNAALGDGGYSDTMIDFAKIFGELSNKEQATSDYKLAKSMLKINAVDTAMEYSPVEKELKKTDPQKAASLRAARVERIDSIFSKQQLRFINSASDEMYDAMRLTHEMGRLKTYSGFGLTSFDAQAGGVASRGLTLVIAGPGGGKSFFMKLFAANHLNHFMDEKIAKKKDAKKPRIWGFIGEDTIDTYTNDMLQSLSVRRAEELELDPKDSGSLLSKLFDNESTADRIELLRKDIMSECDWIGNEGDAEDLLGFTVLKMLKFFEARLEAAPDKKPDMILLDYLQLMQLAGGSNRVEDLNRVATTLNTWATNRGIAIIAGVQSTIDALGKNQDLSFYGIGDIADAKGVARPAFMVLSLMAIQEYTDDGVETEMIQAIKIIKNRGPGVGKIFLSKLDYEKGIGMRDTREISKKDWQAMIMRIRNIKAELNGEEPGAGRGGQGTWKPKPRTWGERGPQTAPDQGEKQLPKPDDEGKFF